MAKNAIEQIVQQIDELFRKFNRDAHAFTVDYDEETDGLYCNYVPYANDTGFAVSQDLLIVTETPKADLQALREFLNANNISSRIGHEWSAAWGLGENDE